MVYAIRLLMVIRIIRVVTFMAGAMPGLLLGAALPLPLVNPSQRIAFPNSLRGPDHGSAVTANIVRSALTASETAATLRVTVTFAMPHLRELETRIHSGEKIPQAEMEARYLPPKSRTDALSAWLTSSGLNVEGVDANHTSVTVTGTVAQLSAAFGVTFARVSTPDGEFTSAVTTPSLPHSIGDGVLAIIGLEHTPRPHPVSAPIRRA